MRLSALAVTMAPRSGAFGRAALTLFLAVNVLRSAQRVAAPARTRHSRATVCSR